MVHIVSRLRVLVAVGVGVKVNVMVGLLLSCLLGTRDVSIQEVIVKFCCVALLLQTLCASDETLLKRVCT